LHGFRLRADCRCAISSPRPSTMKDLPLLQAFTSIIANTTATAYAGRRLS
jgi:hypothetical protein